MNHCDRQSPSNGRLKKTEVDEIVASSLKRLAHWAEVKKDRLKTRAMALSDGQQQRFCIARTVAVRLGQ